MYWDRSGPKIPGCLSVCVSVCVCVCVCLSVCLSVCPHWHGDTNGPISMKLCKIGSLYVWLCAFVFQLNGIIDDTTAAILSEKTILSVLVFQCRCQPIILNFILKTTVALLQSTYFFCTIRPNYSFTLSQNLKCVL